MQTIFLNKQNLNYWQSRSTKNVIALGFFDGVHKGHQKVIQIAKQEANKRGIDVAVMSFFPHPKFVLSKGKNKIDYLMPLEEKAERIAALGVDRFYIVEFNEGFASLSPQDYVNQYLLKFNTVHAVAGYDFTYGHKGAGNISSMPSDALRRLSVTKVDKVEYLGEKISSTRLRDAIIKGNVEDVEALTGHSYQVEGKIENESFLISDYYLLPGDGLYEITIYSKKGVFHTYLEMNSKDYLSKIRHKNISRALDGLNVSIVWGKRVSNYSLSRYS